MLDRDLAELFGVLPRRLREQVKRNELRFPASFMFQLTESEVDTMVSQNATPSKQILGGHLPYVFTEYGVLMLATILKSERAIQASIKIIEIFVKMREILSTNKAIIQKLEKIENKLMAHDTNIKEIFDFLKLWIDNPEAEKRTIGFKMQNAQF